MKRIFPIIIFLITVSLIGAILIQISWLKNMLLLKKDQVEEKVKQIASNVGEELAQYKGASATAGLRSFPGANDGFSLESPRYYNVGQRFTSQELYDKIEAAFIKEKIEYVPFEFALVTFKNDIIGQIERQSTNFTSWYEDSVNYFPKLTPLIPPTGSAAENLASDEWLIV
ncbi:MAG TPA: hypothetical protein VFR58_10535, partial [Flavisolibacter sp.]|nr:hypothetical protein [Flavisolibacter sp.]